MNLVRRKGPCPGRFICTGVVAFSLAIAMGTPSAWAAERPSDGTASPSPATADSLAAGFAVDDVVLQPGGVLQGRLIAADADSTPGNGNLAARRAIVLRAGQLVAETNVDPQGRFALRRLSPGAVDLVVTGPQGAHWRHCRLWTAEAAPPASVAEVRVSDGGPTIRGQVTFVRLGFPKALAVAGIAAGAIAVPIIHNDIQHAHQPPHSP